MMKRRQMLTSLAASLAALVGINQIGSSLPAELSYSQARDKLLDELSDGMRRLEKYHPGEPITIVAVSGMVYYLPNLSSGNAQKILNSVWS